MTRAVYLTLAALVPLAALWFAAPPERAAQGLAVRPFGWPSLLVVHVLAAVPAAWVLVRFVYRLPTSNHTTAALGGVLLALIVYWSMDFLGELLDAAEAGFIARSLARTFWCVLLAFPWCVAANTPVVAGRSDPLAAAAAAVAALALPAMYADRSGDQALAEAITWVNRARPVKAAPHFAAAADVSPNRRMPGGSDRETVAQKRARLAAVVATLAKEADLPPRRPSLQHALVLIALDRLTDADEYLRPLAARDPLARLYLGECLQLRERWDEGDAELRATLAALLPRAADRLAAEDCAKAYDLLAESATKRNRPADREAVLREALERLPAQAGYFRMQLGRHFKLSGRPFEALAEFDRAEATDAKLKPEIDALRRNIREHTPGCLVR